MDPTDRCKYCLNEACLFLNLSRQELAFRPEDFTQLLEYDRGQTLFPEGAPLYGYSIICEGTVKLVRRLKDGRKLIVAVLGPGDILGLGTNQGGRVRLEAEALERTRVGFVDRRDFEQLVGRYPHLAAALIQKLSDEIIELQERLLATTRRGARSKLAALLLQLAINHGRASDQGILIDLALTGSELAEMAGVSRETVSLTLSFFKSQGLVTLQKRKLVIRDKAGLEVYS